MLFSRIPPIYAVIDEYAAWKYERHPIIAGGQRSILIRFAQSFKLERVEDIEDVHIAYYVGEQLSAFYGEQALKAIRAFLWYCHRAGYNVFSYKMATEKNLKKAGRKTDWEMVKKVKDLKDKKGMGYLLISRELSDASGRKIHRNSVARWYKKASQLPF